MEDDFEDWNLVYAYEDDRGVVIALARDPDPEIHITDEELLRLCKLRNLI